VRDDRFRRSPHRATALRSPSHRRRVQAADVGARSFRLDGRGADLEGPRATNAAPSRARVRLGVDGVHVRGGSSRRRAGSRAYDWPIRARRTAPGSATRTASALARSSRRGVRPGRWGLAHPTASIHGPGSRAIPPFSADAPLGGVPGVSERSRATRASRTRLPVPGPRLAHARRRPCTLTTWSFEHHVPRAGASDHVVGSRPRHRSACCRPSSVGALVV